MPIRRHFWTCLGHFASISTRFASHSCESSLFMRVFVPERQLFPHPYPEPSRHRHSRRSSAAFTMSFRESSHATGLTFRSRFMPQFRMGMDPRHDAHPWHLTCPTRHPPPRADKVGALLQRVPAKRWPK